MLIVRIEEHDGKTVKEVGVMLLTESGDKRKPVIDIVAKTVAPGEVLPQLADKVIVAPGLKSAVLNEIPRKSYKKWDLVAMALNKMEYGRC